MFHQIFDFRMLEWYVLISLCSQGSPCDERQLRSENDETDIRETSISGQGDFSSHIDILDWAKVCISVPMKLDIL